MRYFLGDQRQSVAREGCATPVGYKSGMDILHDALGFAAKAFIIFATVAVTVAFVVAIVRRRRPAGAGLRVRALNDDIDALGDVLRFDVLGKKELRRIRKARKRDKAASRPRVFVLEFKGDLFASAVQ